MAELEPYTVEQVAAAVFGAIERTSEYHNGGKVLALALFRLLPEGVSPGEWRGRLDGLGALVNRSEGPDVPGVLAWLDRELLPIMRCIPAKERTMFVRGVIRMTLPSDGTFEVFKCRGRRRTHGGKKNRKRG
jgi:hypothetical protein